MPLPHDSAPIIGYFNDRDTAEGCLRQLRNSGVLNEQIGVSYAGSTVISAANYPGVQRATGQRNSTSEIEDEVHEDANSEGMPGMATPDDGHFDSEDEAKGYQHLSPNVMVSVSIEPARREEIRNLLHEYGARLNDWPASNDQVA